MVHRRGPSVLQLGWTKKRQSDLTFQMKVLLYKNKDLLRLHRHLVSKDRKKAAARAKKVLEQSVGATSVQLNPMSQTIREYTEDPRYYERKPKNKQQVDDSTHSFNITSLLMTDCMCPQGS